MPRYDEKQGEESEEDEPAFKKAGSGEKSEQLKASHIAAEKKRRDAIKDGYTVLAESLPLEKVDSNKLTRGEVLDHALAYIGHLNRTKEEKEKEEEELKLKLQTLQIVQGTYENMPRVYNDTVGTASPQKITPHIKLKLFTTLILRQFDSFSTVVHTDTKQGLTSSLFYWLELNWRPLDLKDYLHGLLRVLRTKFSSRVFSAVRE